MNGMRSISDFGMRRYMPNYECTARLKVFLFMSLACLSDRPTCNFAIYYVRTALKSWNRFLENVLPQVVVNDIARKRLDNNNKIPKKNTLCFLYENIGTMI